ncbi:helix-turn-helix domain-containing protein [Uliginosibacterium sp. 31-12]|uniref:helix-turn-helix domain-containing protein n=1 Tax=Uliginosibacterium sp. 31-12 TaxID=3062781 RepID=UPI0026E12772|nr:helix-turn-helix transcriptional regulator [Uliginosibacterium sp. 31-12]MDO6386902.1 helix-turn-helix transcriptional regulator [Uliginosibacterium sp. 31-12]
MSKRSNAQSALPPEAAQQLVRLGERLRAHRTQQQWTIAEMAARVLCSPTTYRALESGKPTTSTGVLMNVLWLLGQADTLDAVAPAPAALASGRRVRRKAGKPKAGTISEDERDF